MFREAEALLKQIQNAGLALKDGFSSVEVTTISKSDLAECLVREMSEKEKVVPFVASFLRVTGSYPVLGKSSYTAHTCDRNNRNNSIPHLAVLIEVLKMRRRRITKTQARLLAPRAKTKVEDDE
ncbi:hypothetical protein LguiA_017661 [Lonicera macranthoides]